MALLRLLHTFRFDQNSTRFSNPYFSLLIIGNANSALASLSLSFAFRVCVSWTSHKLRLLGATHADRVSLCTTYLYSYIGNPTHRMNQKVGGRVSNVEFQYSLLEINHKMSNQSVEVRKEGGRLLTFYFCLVTTYSISNTRIIFYEQRLWAMIFTTSQIFEKIKQQN